MPQTPQKLTPEKAAQLTNILRLGGAFLILGGMVIGLDVGGAATKIGLNDGSEESMHQLIGGAFALVGLADFFVLPAFFKRISNKQDQSL